MNQDHTEHACWWVERKSHVRGDQTDEQFLEVVRWFFARTWYDCRCRCTKVKECHKTKCPRTMEYISDDADWGMLLDESVDPPHMLGALVILMAKRILPGVQAAAARVTIESIDLCRVNLLEAFHALMGLGLEKSAGHLLEVLDEVAYKQPARMSDMMQQALLGKAKHFPDGVGVVEAMVTGTHGWGKLHNMWQMQAVLKGMKLCIGLNGKAMTNPKQNPFVAKYGPKQQSLLSFFPSTGLSFSADECDLRRIFGLIESDDLIHQIVQYLPINPGTYAGIVSSFLNNGRLAELTRHFAAMKTPIEYPHPVAVALDNSFGLRFVRENIAKRELPKTVLKHGKDMLEASAVPDPHGNFGTACKSSMDVVMKAIKKFVDVEEGHVHTGEEADELRDKLTLFIGYPPRPTNMEDLEFRSNEKRKRDELIAKDNPDFVPCKLGRGILNYWGK